MKNQSIHIDWSEERRFRNPVRVLLSYTPVRENVILRTAINRLVFRFWNGVEYPMSALEKRINPFANDEEIPGWLNQL